jgi:adenylate kinase
MMEEAAAAKKKGPEVTRDELQVRFPDDMLVPLYRKQLTSNACKNRGFILDGFPRTFADAESIFYDKPIKPEEGEGEEGEEPKEEIPGCMHTNLLPQGVIIFKGDNDFLKTRVKEKVPEEELANSHWNDEGMNRRLKVYRDTNEIDGENSVADFFKNNGAEVTDVQADLEEPELLKVISEFSKKHGAGSTLPGEEEEDDSTLIERLEKEEERKREEERKLAE